MGVKITKRVVDAADAGGKDRFIWDGELKGFGLKITPNGIKVYVLQYHFGSGRNARRRRMSIGRHGSPWTPEAARDKAKKLLFLVADGGDPAEDRAMERKAIDFAALCDLYLAEGVSHKKASTLIADRGRIASHLKPLLGRKRLDTITRADIERLLTDVTSGKTAASRSAEGNGQRGRLAVGGVGVAGQSVTLASTILSFAVDRGMIEVNPARGVKKPPVRKMERFLSEHEMTRLAGALDAEEGEGGIYGAAAIRLLALTGCRRSEIVNLLWSQVDSEAGREYLRLPDSKTGAKVVFLNPPAVAILAALPRVAGNPYVIAGRATGEPLRGLDKVWYRVCKAAGLGGVRLHDLRHSFASFGVGDGLGLPVIGALLGHRQAMTTARYAHLSDDPVRSANDRIGARIASMMTARPGNADEVEPQTYEPPQPRRRGSRGGKK